MSFQICFLYTLTAACTCFCITYSISEHYADCCVCLFISRCFLPPAPPGSAASTCRRRKKKKKKKKPRRPRETAVAAVENVRTRQRKQTGRQLSVFLCEVIMCSPRCFCSHANEVDRVGNHFQTLNRGKSRKGKTKAATKGCFAVVCVQKWR